MKLPAASQPTRKKADGRIRPAKPRAPPTPMSDGKGHGSGHAHCVGWFLRPSTKLTVDSGVCHLSAVPGASWTQTSEMTPPNSLHLHLTPPPLHPLSFLALATITRAMAAAMLERRKMMTSRTFLCGGHRSIVLPLTRLKRAGTLLTLVHTHSRLYLLPDNREPDGESERE